MPAPCDFGGHTSHQCVPPAGRRAWNVVPLLSAGRDGACETRGPPAPPRTRTHARTPLRFNSVSKTRCFVTLSVPFPHPVTWKFSDVVAPNPALAPHLPPLRQAAASGPAASRSPACPGQSILLDSEAFALELIESRTQAAGGQTLREGGAGPREGPWARWTGQSAGVSASLSKRRPRPGLL